MDNAFKRDVSGTLMVWFKAGNKFTQSIEYMWVQKQKGRIWQTSKQGEQTRELEMKSQNNKHWLWILGNRMNKAM